MKLRTAITFACLFIFVALIAALVYVNQREALVEDGQIRLPGLRNPVLIYFDKPAVPYIQARSQEDLLLAQGYITASERLFQMDMLRRVAKGEMAAVFGGSCLSGDRLARIIGFRRLAEAEYGILPESTKQWLKYYCQGVNAYISQEKNKLPLEFVVLGYKPQAWQPEDTLAVLKYLQYASDECWQLNVLKKAIKEKAGAEIARRMFGQWPDSRQLISDSAAANISKLPDLNRLTKILPPLVEQIWGSNGWVIASKLSQSGGCLLACDKHALFTFPDLFFSCSLRCPLTHVAGLTIPGVPGILIGRNDHIAWAPISIKGHWQDLSYEQFSEKSPDRYLGSQAWLKAQEFEEEISQRFASSVIEKVLVTQHGPLLVKNEQTGVALNWYGFNPGNNILESIWALNSAKNFSEFQLALQKYKGSPQVFLYSDTTGNIANQIAGYRAKQLSLAANNNENQAEYIVANAQPPAVSANLSSLGALSNNWAALRATNFLKTHQLSGRALSLEDMITLQSDMKASLNDKAIKSLRMALQNTKSIDQYQQNALVALSNWDGQLKENSYSACLYESFLTELTKQALQEKIGLPLTYDYINKWPRWSEFTLQLLEKQPSQFLPLAQRDFSSFLSNCFSQSFQNLRVAFDMKQMPGILPGCQWQNMHMVDIRANLAKFIPPAIIGVISPFLPGTIGLGGDQDCVNACNYFLADKSFRYDCNSGPTARLIIDMADNDKFYQAITFGQGAHLFSGDRMSQANNQLDLWRNMKFHAIAFSDQELDILAVHHLTLIGDTE